MEMNPYEAERAQRIAANKERMRQLQLLQHAQALDELKEQPAARNEAPKRRNLGPRTPVDKRRSGRNNATVNYDEAGTRLFSLDGRPPTQRRARVRGRDHGDRDIITTANPSVRGGWHIGKGLASYQASEDATDAALRFIDTLQNPADYKVMTESQVSGGFWSSAPRGLSSHLERVKHTIYMTSAEGTTLPDGSTDGPDGAPLSSPVQVVWLPRKGDDAGFSGGWRAFSIIHDLYPGDVIVWEVLPSENEGEFSRNLKVHIFRAFSYEAGGFPTVLEDPAGTAGTAGGKGKTTRASPCVPKRTTKMHSRNKKNNNNTDDGDEVEVDGGVAGSSEHKVNNNRSGRKNSSPSKARVHRTRIIYDDDDDEATESEDEIQYDDEEEEEEEDDDDFLLDGSAGCDIEVDDEDVEDEDVEMINVGVGVSAWHYDLNTINNDDDDDDGGGLGELADGDDNVAEEQKDDTLNDGDDDVAVSDDDKKCGSSGDSGNTTQQENNNNDDDSADHAAAAAAAAAPSFTPSRFTSPSSGGGEGVQKTKRKPSAAIAAAVAAAVAQQQQRTSQKKRPAAAVAVASVEKKKRSTKTAAAVGGSGSGASGSTKKTNTISNTSAKVTTKVQNKQATETKTTTKKPRLDTADDDDEHIAAAAASPSAENVNTNGNASNTDSDDDSDEDVPSFYVERIEDSRLKSDGTREYLIKWLNYPVSENSWEPREMLDDDPSKYRRAPGVVV